MLPRLVLWVLPVLALLVLPAAAPTTFVTLNLNDTMRPIR
jgi:hypothetical protein